MPDCKAAGLGLAPELPLTGDVFLEPAQVRRWGGITLT